ncbi:hypothetical protein D3C83_80490 [compost metagenome]
MRDFRDPIVTGAVYRRLPAREQPPVAAHVVGVVMGVEDRDQLKLFPLQVIDHRPSVTGIHHRGARLIADRPHVVVGKRAQGYDFK